MIKIIGSDFTMGMLQILYQYQNIIKKIKPDEIYNLAAQSHVAVSFEVPEYTANADALGALRILEAIKFHKLEKNKVLSGRNFRNVWQSTEQTSK